MSLPMGDNFEAELAEAREWVAACVWADLEPGDVAELRPFTVVRGVEFNYPGGWDAFVSECVPAGTAV